MQTKILAASVLALSVLSACTEREIILPGERLGVREVLQETGPDAQDLGNVTLAANVPAAVNNGSWAQSHVSPWSRTTNAALSSTLTPVWSTPIGQGDKRRARIITDPVVADGRVFTVDSAGRVTATSTNGEALWTYSLVPLRDDASQALAGGLAHSNGRLYVTSGFGTLTALDASSGTEIWTQRLQNGATGAPTVFGGLVYVVAGDSTAWAIEEEDGRVRWESDGLGDVGNVAGAAPPAVNNTHVVFSFGSGAVQGAFRQGGLRLWSADIVGARRGFAIALVDDITGYPVIDGNTVYAGNHSGRVVALNINSGERLWTAQHGALEPVWPAGGSVYLVSDLNQLIRLDATDGTQIWAVDLPGYEPVRRPQRRRDSAFTNHGPIMAGGRLIVASSDGVIRSFDPASGDLISETPIRSGATTRPVVANGTLYVVSKNGTLHAYR
ncbi:PQQ-binding-like beta-propeller repeat protein [Marivita hallyeonensis]|uniref:Outer membrane protein assembly factor BamB, contains PQQ-like beta-propeller repeat n=1 Tax=Marivita hallyeonensis TaxID=996342 RepID=A0A1M5VH05_9RHOB|nr:PQQ-binding-like beta-propeller repeat protein [Marivita hallyeonensis]SHH74468.1 Outer membrane protein assembly factor BamB, contains PQQ-like beta-propeller repeat [Marivita hallyeonensis]